MEKLTHTQNPRIPEQTCRRSDLEIQRKIDRGIWRPSVDTGHVYSTEKHGNLVEMTGKDGYLYIISNGTRNVPVSRIIWIAANGVPDFGMEVDHINGNRQDNRLENLQLVTPEENHMRAHAVLTFADAEEIRRKNANGASFAVLANEYGVAKSTISGIVSRKTYKSRPPHERHAALAKQQMETLDSETFAEICAEYQNGASYSQIARRHRLAVTTVKAVIQRGGTRC